MSALKLENCPNIVDLRTSEVLKQKMQEEYKTDKTTAYNMKWLMNNPDHAIGLQLTNLVATYGVDAVSKQLTQLKKKAKAA